MSKKKKKKKKHFRKIVTISLVSIYIALELILTYLSKRKLITFSETLYYWSQILSSVFVVAGVIIAVWQYYLSCKNTKNNLEMTQVKHAIDLSEYYKDNILIYYPALKYIFENSGIYNILESIKANEMKDFDSKELKDILSTSQIEKLKQIQYSDRFIDAVIDANNIYDLGLKVHTTTQIIDNDGNKTVTFTINKTNVATAFASNLLSLILNNMEYFAMNFHHQVADQSVVYQSLHQSYFKIVTLLYYHIASKNTDSTGKYYTNVIWLYHTWRNKKEKQTTARSTKSSELESHGTVISNND